MWGILRQSGDLLASQEGLCSMDLDDTWLVASADFKRHLRILLHIRTVRLDIVKVFYSPTEAQVNCRKNNIKIDIKTVPTCFGAVTPSSGSTLCAC
jgi:hypothetical protein